MPSKPNSGNVRFRSLEAEGQRPATSGFLPIAKVELRWLPPMCAKCFYQAWTIAFIRGALVRLFHPRQDRWDDHYARNGVLIVRSHAVGRTVPARRQSCQSPSDTAWSY
jgi:hypothetical protein